MKKLFTAFFILCCLTSFGQKALHLYGGKGHDVYLGCLNCSRYDASSIWNSYGTYGSRFSATSIWNSFGNYGSEFSATSPFNRYAMDPPVIVDAEGGFYGYFTVNEYKGKRADFQLVLVIYQYYNVIREDLSEWYDKIFR